MAYIYMTYFELAEQLNYSLRLEIIQLQKAA
jgi:hypothetical protein